MNNAFWIHYSWRLYFPSTSRLVQRGKARVPERTSLHSFNLLWLIWAVCGGFFITNFILSNFVAILMKPVFEEPVDNAHVTCNYFSKIFIDILNCRMYMTEIFLSICAPVVLCGGKKCWSYLFPSLFWHISKYNVLEKESFFYFAVYDQNTIFTCILSGNTCENHWRFDEVWSEAGKEVGSCLVQVRGASSHQT